MPDQDYSFELDHLSTISYCLIYRQGDKQRGEKQLDIYIEASGSWKFDYVGSDKEFEEWTVPPKQSISAAEQSTIRQRLEAWCQSKKLKIKFSPPVDMDAEIAKYKDEGWTVEVLPDGTVRLSTEPEQGLFDRLRRWLRK